MKNAERLKSLLSQKVQESPESPQINTASPQESDCMAKIEFKNEHLVIRHKNGMTIALR